ncbi:hypothetical protein ACSBR2_025889 [Camellia fascicularis]
MQGEIVRVMKFHEWITERNFDEIWETHEYNIIGLGSLFIELLNKIIKLLMDIHEHDGFNGDLWNNLKIRQIRRTTASGSWDVWMVDLVVNPPPNLSLIDYGMECIDFMRVVLKMKTRKDASTSWKLPGGLYSLFLCFSV